MTKPPGERRLDLLQGTLDMLILRTLQWGPQHGHGIGQAIRQQSEDLLKVETGSLYPALHRLERRGWVRRTPAPDDGRGVLLRLTEDGRAALAGFAVVHIASVRRHLVDVLTADQFADLGATMQVVRDAYAADPTMRGAIPTV